MTGLWRMDRGCLLHVKAGRPKGAPHSVCKAWRDCSLYMSKMSKMLKVLKVLKVLIEHLASLAGWYSSCGGETSVTSRQVLRLWSYEPRYCPRPLPGGAEKVCAISALCAVSPFLYLKGRGELIFTPYRIVSPHGPAACRTGCVFVVKDLPRGRLGAFLLTPNSCSPCGPPVR